MKKVFLILEDWRTNSGESGININIFDNYKKAKKEYFKIKENYLIDYDNEDLEVQEMIKDDNTFIELEGKSEHNSDYFIIKVMDKVVK